MRSILFALTLLLLPNAFADKAIFAGGCFWCMEPPFEKLDGVSAVVSGYIGGATVKPTYEQVSSGNTGHIESIEITFDPKKVSFDRLLDIYWKQIDPTDKGGAFCDRGEQYSSAIFFVDDAQKLSADTSKAKIAKLPQFKDKTISVEIRKAGTFYTAEEYHQDYYKKNPVRYKYYRFRCGRDQALDKVWGKDRPH